MQMTDGEVVLNVMQAKDQKAQITICADLNCCSEDKIKDILRANDIDLRSLRGGVKKRIAQTKKHKPHTKSTVPANAAEKSANAEENPVNAVPESPLDALLRTFGALKYRVRELLAQKAAIEEELVRIDIECNKVEDLIAGRSDEDESPETMA